jgi:hypothetical protein
MRRIIRSIAAAVLFVASTSHAQVTVSPNVFYDAPDFDVTDGVIDADNLAPGNQITLRAILMHANFHGGNWKILLPSGAFSLSVPGNGEDFAAAGDLDINGITLEIEGVPFPAPTIIDASALGDRAFHSLGGSRVTMRFLDIQGASSVGGGGFRQNNGQATLENITIQTCTATGAAGANGGGILSFAKLTLTDCTIAFNGAQGAGAGIQYEGTDLSMTGCSVYENQAGGRGGGINIATTGSISVLHKCSIANNRSGTAVGGGSGGGIGNRGSLTLTNCFIEKNFTSAGASGGGIENRGHIIARDCTIRENGAFFGAGIQIAGLSSALLDNCTVDTNFGDTGGGCHNAGTLEIRHSTISRNHALGPAPVGGGGGIYSFGTLYIVNSTISSNIAPAGLGGGLYNSNNGNCEISSSTFQSNTSNFGRNIANGDIGFLPLVVVRNSLFSTYPPVPGAFNYHSPSGMLVGTQGHNLDTDGSMSLMTASDIQPFIPGTVIEPFLGPLQLNGGATETHRLFFASVAIGAANGSGCVDQTGLTLVTDQRHFARPNVATADIGAYEAGCDADLFPPGGGDGFVDDFDFVEFANYYNILLTSGADFDGDGDTDDPDFVVFAAAYDLLLCE